MYISIITCLVYAITSSRKLWFLIYQCVTIIVTTQHTLHACEFFLVVLSFFFTFITFCFIFGLFFKYLFYFFK